MLKYSNEFRKNNVIYSIDKLIIDFKFLYLDGTYLDNEFLRWVSSNLNLEYTHWVSTKFASYNHQFSFTCGDDEKNSFWVGVGFNSHDSSGVHKARIEFNPNKVYESYVFRLVFNALMRFSLRSDIRRFDIAFDYPVLRENAFLIKNHKKYREDRRSFNDRTQYLGSHNSHGFVKLYNKKIESGLNFPLTRLEITLDYEKSSFEDFQLVMPVVKVLEDLQLTFDEIDLTDTDRFIVHAAFDNPEDLSLLGRRKRQKIECILERYTQILNVDYDTYNKVLKSMDIYKASLPNDFEYNPFTGTYENVSSM